MEYRVGDKVRIKSLDWYNENKDNYDCVYAGNGFGFWKNMSRHCGEIMKITTVKVDPEDSNKGFYFMENSEERWTDEMIECKVESIEDKMKELRKMCTISLTDSNYTDKVEVLLNNYEYIEEDGKAYFVKKKTEYPKTYEACCKVMGINHTNDLDICEHCDYKTEITFYEDSLLEKIETLYRLIICRDAYWKIYGEEMGLGKSWEPDWNNGELKWCMFYSGNYIEFDQYKSKHHTLAFPIAEMRDAFYENFKEEIEICKELL